jgi:hypothetical protein
MPETGSANERTTAIQYDDRQSQCQEREKRRGEVQGLVLVRQWWFGVSVFEQGRVTGGLHKVAGTSMCLQIQVADWYLSPQSKAAAAL